MNNKKKFQLPLALSISLSFSLLLLLTGGIVTAINYKTMKDIMLSSTSEIIKRSGQGSVSEILGIYEPVESFTKLLSRHPITETSSTQERLSYLPFLREGLDSKKEMSAVFIGYEDGSFFLLRRISPNYKPTFPVPEGAVYLLQTKETIKDKPPEVVFYFYDTEFLEVGKIVPESYEYDPRSRDWYLEAKEKNGSIRTEPYVFFTTKEVGRTFAIPSRSGTAVIGIDITLTALSESLKSQKISSSMQIAIIDSKKNTLAYLKPDKMLLKAEEDKVRLAKLNELGVSVLTSIEENFTKGRRGNFSITDKEFLWLVYVAEVPISSEEVNYLIMAAPENELLYEANESLNQSILLTLGLVVFSVPFVFLIAVAISRSLKRLTGFATSINNLNFSVSNPKGSKVSELDELSQTMGTMKSTIRNFLDISSLLTTEKNFNKLIERILLEIVHASGTKAGILYILSDDENFLLPKAIYSHEKVLVSSKDSLPISLNEESKGHSFREEFLAAKRFVVRTTKDSYLNEFKELGENGDVDHPYLCAIPLKNQSMDLIGYLCLFDEIDISRTPALSFVESLSGTASVAIENNRLVEAQKKLFEAFIRLIASAIDTKSPYTGGHCSRVPEIATLLANAVISEKTGIFAGFDLDDEEKEALHIGAWLHDCGKIVTPEYVVDKATKLETIYDRIHEIRMRFEVVKRDKQIRYYKRLLDGGDNAVLSKELENELKTIDEEYSFIASCNEGGEYLPPEKIEKIKKIASRTWERTLDDTIGISHEEKKKLVNKNKTLPYLETLLANKPEHIIERTEADKIPPNNPWGFKMQVPQYKFNRGEVYNLCIARGTLTEEERFIINAHMIQTIKMLKELPFPKHLKNVPEIAGGHHEKMDGTGYPRRLKKEEMSIPARIMAIADIFEALTAVDRPYKKGKTLSETISIMHKMKAEQHIDTDLFDIFLTSGVYLEYARKYMQPYQIDEVDISKYVVLHESKIESEVVSSG